MFSVRRQDELKPHPILTEDESFVDVGANVGYYNLKIAKNYENKAVTVIAMEAQPENFKVLGDDINCNNLTTVLAINKAVSDDLGC